MLGSPIIADDNHAEDRAGATEGPEKGVDVAPEQSSYLSQISQIILVAKKLSSGEILGNFERFCHNLELSFGEKLSPKSTFVEKKLQI